MEQVRGLLPNKLRDAMEQKLGREEALRLMWPAVVGPKLAAQIQLLHLRGNNMVVSMPDGEWRGPLQSLERMILDAVNRFSGKSTAISIEFVVGLPPVPVLKVAEPPRKMNPPVSNLHHVPPDVPAPVIPVIDDERLRDAFAQSAQKYFAHQEMMAK